MTIAATAGRVEGPGDIRIAAREEFTIVNTSLNESPCGEDTVLSNNVFQSSQDESGE